VVGRRPPDAGRQAGRRLGGRQAGQLGVREGQGLPQRRELVPAGRARRQVRLEDRGRGSAGGDVD
jgi:hypothetical protein